MVTRTKQEVGDIIEHFIDGTGGNWDWDDFCSHRIVDPDLDLIRVKCSGLSSTHPPTSKGHFCNENGISHNFSSPRTPQQNGVVERKNRTLQEMARTMLCENSVPRHFWVEAVNTACYVQNRILIRPLLNKTPYELWKGRRPNISYFHSFGCECFILNTKDQIGKFDSKCDKGIFLGYLETSKAYRVYNTRTLVVEESIHVRFNDGLTTNRKLSKPDEDLADFIPQTSKKDSFEEIKDEADGSTQIVPSHQ